MFVLKTGQGLKNTILMQQIYQYSLYLKETQTRPSPLIFVIELPDMNNSHQL